MKFLNFTLLSFLFFAASTSAQSPGNSLSFDGTNDHVSAALPTLFTNISGNDFTTEFWVKPEGSGTQRPMAAQQDGSNFTSVLLNSSNEVYYYVVEGGTNHSIKSDAGLPTGTWAHVACTWESGTQTISMYINGVLQSGTGGGTSTSATNGLMYIGANTSGGHNLIGELDEFRIWDYARSECQIQGSMNSEFVSPQTGLIVYYNFNQGTPAGTNTGVTTLPDFTTNYDGTLINFALSGGNSNWLASGATINAVDQNSGGSVTQISDSICEGSAYTFGAQVLNMTGVYYDTLTGSNSCDSIVSLTLTVTDVDSTVMVAGTTLGSAQVGATYQWLDCDNAFAPIPGATNQNFDATTNGNYAVEVTYNGCVDTSHCTTIAGIGYNELSFKEQIELFPNPTSGFLTLQLNQINSEITVVVRGLDGKVVYQVNEVNASTLAFEIQGAAGIYFVEIYSAGEKAIFKVAKE